MKLLINALVKFVSGVILIGILLFLPAGTVYYPSNVGLSSDDCSSYSK